MNIAARTDPLIAERAPWLFSGRPGTAFARAALNHILGYHRTLRLGDALTTLPMPQIMDHLAQMIAQNVTARGLAHIPVTGPALIVANHPTGIADGIILHHLICKRRPDAFIMANADILRVLPQMEELILPVEWRPERRGHAKTRGTMQGLHRALDTGRIGVIFPAGRLAKRRGLRLHERPWMRSAAMIARKFDLSVIPVHIRARNSALFYAFDALHPTLRDITLFHETLNKARQPFRVTIGRPVPPGELACDSAEAIVQLRNYTLALAGHMPAVSLTRACRPVFGQSST
ncbi:glycerol acyltransferase [Rhodophyticola sp. CCM32]|uniref:lysophospholipid acyltransferase family protein n=1 Tax=Rhodophyticola sp. CCM32 TaxID=2916397 RepID=UPI00107F8575|nr:lysophospholipid acyltransferase family protein [Rhodophyticola sp. CCM32]QBX99749.1 glycerol acyltransferase [Rhodophyticola sp. CCM32]